MSEVNLTPTSTGVALPESLVPGVAPGAPDRAGAADVDRDARGRRLDVAAVVDRPGLDGHTRVAVRDPAVGPARRPAGGVPGGASVGGDLDAGDHATGVGRGAADGDLGAVTDGRAARWGRDRRGRRGRVGRRGGNSQPGDQRIRLRTHVGEQVHGGLLHVPVRCPARVCRSPHDHCTVPAPNTSAPLEARYSDKWWVAVPGDLTVLP